MKKLLCIFLMFAGVLLVQRGFSVNIQDSVIQTVVDQGSDFIVVSFSTPPVVFECRFINNYAPARVDEALEGFVWVEEKPPVQKSIEAVLLDNLKKVEVLRHTYICIEHLQTALLPTSKRTNVLYFDYSYNCFI